MSKKLKKKPSERRSGISEEDIKFIKIINIAGWIFLIVFGGFFAVWGLFDLALELIDIKTSSPMVFSFVIFTGISGTFCLALGTKIDKEKDKKREYFLDWLVSEFFFCMFAIFVLSVYQW